MLHAGARREHSGAAAGSGTPPSRTMRCRRADLMAYIDRRGADHVWSYDYRTYDGRAFRMLNVLDEFTRESLAIRVRRKLSSIDVIQAATIWPLARQVGEASSTKRSVTVQGSGRDRGSSPGKAWARRRVRTIPGSSRLARTPVRAISAA